jgi:diguanylate cyclase (GGDEF)-like protein/PAS domain S-box-containing protein
MQIQAEANLSALIESTEDLIWSVDLDDRLVTFNGALQRHIETTFGIRPAAGMFPRDLVPPQRASLLPPVYRRVRAEGPLRIEFPLADGRTLDLALSPILVDGKVTGVSVFGKDITERKAAEGALREADKKYRDIFDGALEGMFQTSLKGKPLTVNPALARMLGYESPDEYLVLIRDVAQDVWADPNERASYLRQVKENGTVLGFDCQLKCKDGTAIWASLNTRRVSGADGQLLYHEGFVLDITERKRAEQARREGLDALRETELVGALGSYVLDIAAGVWTSSQVLDEFFGIGKEYERDVAGWAALIHPDDRAMMTAYFAEEVVGRHKAFDKEYRILRQTDGAECWVHGIGRLEFDAQGKPQKMRGIIKDITERKRVERALAASEHRFRTFFEENGSVMFLADPETGEIVAANRAACEFYGYPKERLVGMFTSQITLGSHEDCLRDRQQALREERSCFCYSHRVANGEVREVELHSSPFEVDGRQLLYAIVNDITERRQAEIQRRNSEEHYRSTFEQAAVGIIHASFAGIILRCNAHFAEMIGYSAEELTGIDVQQITAPEDGPASRAALEQVLSGGVPAGLEKRYLRKDGSPTWVKVTLSIQRDGEGRALYFTGLVEDINARKAAEERLAAAGEALRLSEERYRTAFQTSLDAININRLSDGKYIDVNQAFLDITGFERDEVIGKTSLELGIWAEARDRHLMAEMVRQNSSYRSPEIQFRKKSGKLFWGQMSASMMEVDGVPCVLSVTRDLSESKAAQSEIRNLAFYDPLTGLANRRMLMERLRQTLATSARRGRLHALLLIDLDNLKTLNDTLGHQVGDLLLQEVARRIAACAHEADTVGRLGGDEFVVMLEDLSEVAEEAAAEARAAGMRILTAVSQPYLLDDRECLSASSMGITVFGDQQKSADDILQQADIALHMAKTAGRNTLRFFSPALQAAVNARATMEEGLRQAIKRNQFLLYYQPQIERGRMTGAEALIRWNHPGRGIVSPDEFIPLAEESRLILPLGDWVVETACKQIAAWAAKDETAHLTISVNISALQFRQPEFVEHVLAAIDRTGANPKNLKLELTESMLVENFEEIIAKMTELKSHGLSFSLDDFGTGYSSLAYLKRLPLDQLKIDRAFVRDILVDVTSGAIAQAILSLGRAMDLSVVAEGVESEQQRGFLAGLGCHCFQGDLFSPPLPLEDFQAFL